MRMSPLNSSKNNFHRCLQVIVTGISMMLLCLHYSVQRLYVAFAQHMFFSQHKGLQNKLPLPQHQNPSSPPPPPGRLFPMHSSWPQKPNPGLLVCPQIHSVAFPRCQLPSSPSAKWNVKPHLWRALSPVMQSKQKAKWLFIVLGRPIPPNPPAHPFFLRSHKEERARRQRCVRKPCTPHTHMHECRTAGVCMHTHTHTGSDSHTWSGSYLADECVQSEPLLPSD